MARSAKLGLDYFPMDVDMDEDDKLYAIEAAHPNGFKIIVKLLMAIYREGYYKEWSEKAALVFAGRKGLPIEEVKAVVQTATETGFFSPEMLTRYGILTSAGIQRRYIGGTQKRDRICLYSPYVMVSEHDFTDAIRKKLVFSTEMNGDRSRDGISVEKTPQISTASTQREGVSKGREGERDWGRGNPTPPPAAPAGLERPAGPPAPSDADADPDAERVIPLEGLPDELRRAVLRRERQARPRPEVAASAAAEPRASPGPPGDSDEFGDAPEAQA